MEFFILVLCVINAFLISYLVYLKIKIKKLIKSPQPTQTAEELLHDLTTHGVSLVKLSVERIDPTNILIQRRR